MATNPTDNTTNGGWVTTTPAVDTPATQAPSTPWEAPYISSTIANPDGTPVNAEVKPEVNQVIPTPTPTVTPNLIEVPKTAEFASQAVNDVNLGIASQAWNEAASQIELTKTLWKIDVQQANTKVSNAQENFNEAARIQTDQMIQKNANELEYQKKLQVETEANVAAAKMQQEAENALNAATAAEMKIKQENAEKDAEIANDVAKQSSAIAFAKLGLSFSGAAINTSQQIYAQWARNIAELRSSNAKNYADLRVKIDRVAFDHQVVINSIISDTNEKQFSSKERLRDFIGNAQNNILTSKKEAQKAIQDAITTYKTEAQGREDKMYSDMTNANSKLLTATKEIQASVSATQEASKTKIDLLTKNWQWAWLSEVQKAEYERAAWLPVGTTDRTTNLLSTQGINERLKDLTWVTIALPVATLQNMQNDIKKYMAAGYPMGTAIQMTVDRYKNTIPEVKAAIEAKDKKTNLGNTKTQAEIDKLKSEATENLASVAKMKADSARAASTWYAAAKSTLDYKATITWSDWKSYDQMWNKATQKMEYIPTAVNVSWKIWTADTTSTWKEEVIDWVLKNVEYKPDGTAIVRGLAQASSKNADTSVQTIKKWDTVSRVLIDNATWKEIKNIWEAWAPVDAETAAFLKELQN